MFQRFNVQAREAMDRAAEKARTLGHAFVEPEHLLSSLAEDGDASYHTLLAGPNAGTFDLGDVPLPPARRSGVASQQPVFSPHARRVLAYTVEEADRLGHKRVGTTHLLLALIRDAIEGEQGLRMLRSIGLNLDDARARAKELGSEEQGGDRQDVVPAILFFELDRRAREAEQALEDRIDRVVSENRSLKAHIELLSERLGRLEKALGHLGRR